MNKGHNDTVTMLSDSQLLEQAYAADTISFETLFFRHYDRAYGLQFQPQMQFDLDMAGPFVVKSEPSELMTAYAVGYVLVLLLLALWSFSRRDL